MQTLVKKSILIILTLGLCFSFLSCEMQVTTPSQASDENNAALKLDEQALLANPAVSIVTDPTPITPPLLKMSGTVKKVIVAPGTKSEYSYFVLMVQPVLTTSTSILPQNVILFNKEGRSVGFDSYVGFPVIAVGYMGSGTIGWVEKLVRGLIVTGITLQKPYILDEGVIRYIGLEGGFYGIVATTGNYDPTNLPKEFMQDGLKVKFVARVLDGMASIHMWGTLVEIVKIEKIDNSIYVNLDEKFKLLPAQTAIIKTEELKFTFVEVLSDSRCPTGVECFWAGEAVIAVNVQIKGVDYGTYKMSLPGTGNVLKVGDYTINFADLQPYPTVTKQPQAIPTGIFYITKNPIIIF